MSIFDGKSIFLTGGTGSFGSAFTEYVLANSRLTKLVIFSRDEMKQWEMSNRINDDRIRFRIGDVRDLQRVESAMADCDMVIHAAATKIVPIAEQDPIEAIKTNVQGAINVVEASKKNRVSKVVALSTDKASAPVNLYGATKLVSDRLFAASGSYGTSQTKMAVVRYGNVMGSRGSLIPFLNSLNSGESTPLTDERMTRFMITLEQSINLVELAFSNMNGGEIFVPKIPSMKVIDIIEALRPLEGVKTIGMRPGEKLHEQMISEDEAPYTYNFPGHYRVIPSWIKGSEFGFTANQLVTSNFRYASDTNEEWMSKEQLLGNLGRNR